MDGGAEERDVTNPNRGAEVVAKDRLENHAAGEREGHGEQHVRRFADASECHHEQEKNNRDDRRENDSERLPRMDQVFILAGVIDGHSGCERHLAAHAFLDLVHKAAEVAAKDIGLNKDAQAAVFALDFTGAEHAFDVGNLTERHHRS